jgi:hypothetical protein
MRSSHVIVVLLFPALALAEGAAEFYPKLDALFDKRDDPAALQQFEAEMASALKANPDDYGVLWRAAQLKQWTADGATDRELKKRLGKEAWQLAESAIKKNAGSAEGHYLAAASIGAYSQAAGILNALAEGLEGKFNERLDAAIRLNPGLHHAGPLIVKGRYYFELPWPKRDLEKSAQWLQKAIEKDPAALRAYYYLAETQLKDGKAKQAKETIAKVINGSTAYDPAEARRVQGWAKKLQVEIDKEAK